jgi:hypothetical protein
MTADVLLAIAIPVLIVGSVAVPAIREAWKDRRRHERDLEAAALIREAADFALWRAELEGSIWWDS